MSIGVPSAEKSRSSAQLLVVDDDKIITMTLASALRDAGYEVSEATTPAHALGLCAERAFNLAILDEGMPGMRGTELARALREHHDLPAVFLSAHDNPELIAASTEAGALGFFVKPIDPQRMLPAIHNIVARARDMRALREREAQLQTALTNEREINTAVGIIMERMQVSREAAFEALRRYARSQRQQIVKVANDLLTPVDAANRLLSAITAHQMLPKDARAPNKSRTDDSR